MDGITGLDSWLQLVSIQDHQSSRDMLGAMGRAWPIDHCRDVLLLVSTNDIE